MEAARAEIAAMANAIIDAGQTFDGPVTQVKLVLEGEEAEARARELAPGAEIIQIGCGDTWLRDTGPILSWQAGRLHARSFGFNGWGGKYLYPGDADLSDRLAVRLGADCTQFDFILEGGSVDWDGAGCLLTTDECLLNPNRNGNWTRETAEAALKAALGATEIIWISKGLVNDHTDGHIDNLARFVGPRHVVCQSPNGVDDPHAERLDAIIETLTAFRTQTGEALTVTTLPSPGFVRDAEGDVMPASHMNFIVTNQAVVVPGYNDEVLKAVEVLTPLFPGRTIVSKPSPIVLSEGGSFHCISQQIPTGPEETKP